jgi:hypothetical protein
VSQDRPGHLTLRGNADSVKGRGGDLNICGSAAFNQIMLDVWREVGHPMPCHRHPEDLFRDDEGDDLIRDDDGLSPS